MRPRGTTSFRRRTAGFGWTSSLEHSQCFEVGDTLSLLEFCEGMRCCGDVSAGDLLEQNIEGLRGEEIFATSDLAHQTHHFDDRSILLLFFYVSFMMFYAEVLIYPIYPITHYSLDLVAMSCRY